MTCPVCEIKVSSAHRARHIRKHHPDSISLIRPRSFISDEWKCVCGKSMSIGHKSRHRKKCNMQRENPIAEPIPHPQLSTYLDIDKYDWRSKCPASFEVGVKPLSGLDPETILQWNGKPPILKQSNVHLSEEEVSLMILSSPHKSSNYQVFCDGTAPPELSGGSKATLSDKKFALASKALYQAITTAPQHSIFSVLNIWSLDKSKLVMQPPQQVQSSHHLCTEDFVVGLNITPAGSFIDLHIDNSQRGLIKTIGKCKKTILLFDADISENMALFIESMGFPNRLARIGSKLRGGIIAQIDSTQELEFKAGTIHAVFTTEGGFLAGINYSTAECLPTMSRLLKAYLSVYHVCSGVISDDIQSYIDTFSSTLQMKLESVLFDTLKSWVELQPDLRKVLGSGNATSQFQKQMHEINKCLKLFGQENRNGSRCGCGQYFDNIGKHVVEVHMI